MVEALEDQRHLRGGNAGALVGHGDGALRLVQPQANAPPRRREFHGVVHGDHEHLAQAGIVAHDLGMGGRLLTGKGQALLGAQGAGAHGHVAKQLAQVHGREVQRKVVALQARKLQKVANEVLEPARLPDHLGVIGAHGLRAGHHAVAQGLQRPADHRDRGFQLVADAGKQPLLRQAVLLVAAARLLQALGQHVHRARQRAHLVAPPGVQGLHRMAGGQRHGDLFHPDDGPREQPRKHQRQHRRKHEGDQPAGDEDGRAGHLLKAQLAQRGVQKHHAQHAALRVHHGHGGAQAGFAVHLGMDDGRFAHEAQGDALLQIARQQGALQYLHHAVKVAGHVVVRIHQVDVAAGELLGQGQVGGQVFFADDEAGFVQRGVVGGGRHQLREVLGDGEGVALHGLAVMRDGLAHHQRVVDHRGEDGKGRQQQRKQQHQPHGERALHGSRLSNL